MITITSNPQLVVLQGQPVVFRVSSNMGAEPFFKVMAVPVSGQSELLPLNADDEAVFDLREYFLPELSISFSTDARVHTDAAKAFTVYFYEYYGNPPAQEDSASFALTVVRGTVPNWMQAEFQTTWASLAAFRALRFFMSWYPNTIKTVLPDQPEKLFFLAPSAATFAPAVAITFSDGTTASLSPAISIAATANQMVSLPVGYTALGLAAVNPSKTVASYVVTISGFSRTYVVDHSPRRDVRYIIFRNSLGGYDVLPCTGEVESLSERSASIAERVYDPEASARISRYVYQTELKEVEKVNTGWLAANEKRWLNDLMLSDDVFEMLGGVLRPVMVRNSDLDRTERIYEPGSVVIEFERLTYVQ